MRNWATYTNPQPITLAMINKAFAQAQEYTPAVPVVSPSFFELLDRTIRDTYIPALQEQLSRNILGDLIGAPGRGRARTPEEQAEWEATWARQVAERAAEDAKYDDLVRNLKRMVNGLPERVRDRLLDDLDDDRYDD